MRLISEKALEKTFEKTLKKKQHSRSSDLDDASNENAVSALLFIRLSVNRFETCFDGFNVHGFRKVYKRSAFWRLIFNSNVPLSG